jgi:hypothetical protein
MIRAAGGVDPALHVSGRTRYLLLGGFSPRGSCDRYLSDTLTT